MCSMKFDCCLTVSVLCELVMLVVTALYDKAGYRRRVLVRGVGLISGALKEG